MVEGKGKRRERKTREEIFFFFVYTKYQSTRELKSLKMQSGTNELNAVMIQQNICD